MIHIWHEDSTNSSTQQFWKFLQSNQINPLLKNADIQGFSSNKNLRNHIKECIENHNIHKADTYYIFMDCVQDNEVAYRLYNNLLYLTNGYNNIKVMDLLCFEYLMLKFKYLENWIKPIRTSNKNFEKMLELRNIFIDIVETNKDWTKNKYIVQFVMAYGKAKMMKGEHLDFKHISEEYISTLMLSKLTSWYNADFCIVKTTLGNCWTCNCLYCNKKYKSKCRRNSNSVRIENKEPLGKAKLLWQYTDAHKYIK